MLSINVEFKVNRLIFTSFIQKNKMLLHNNDHITNKQVLAEKLVNFIAVSFTSPV